MMQEETVDDEPDQVRPTRGRAMPSMMQTDENVTDNFNDTYADFDESPDGKDPGETREEYDSEEEEKEQRKINDNYNSSGGIPAISRNMAQR